MANESRDMNMRICLSVFGSLVQTAGMANTGKQCVPAFTWGGGCGGGCWDLDSGRRDHLKRSSELRALLPKKPPPALLLAAGRGDSPMEPTAAAVGLTLLMQPFQTQDQHTSQPEYRKQTAS